MKDKFYSLGEVKAERQTFQPNLTWRNVINLFRKFKRFSNVEISSKFLTLRRRWDSNPRELIQLRGLATPRNGPCYATPPDFCIIT